MESGGNFEDYKLVYIRFLSCHLFGPVNHGQTWKGWERSGEKGLIINDHQAQTCLIITINDTSTGDLPLIITISDTCKNQPKILDFDNTINLSSLIVILGALCDFQILLGGSRSTISRIFMFILTTVNQRYGKLISDVKVWRPFLLLLTIWEVWASNSKRCYDG